MFDVNSNKGKPRPIRKHFDDRFEGLDDPPSGRFPEPPVVTAKQTLPFAALPWDEFERLCWRLVKSEAENPHARRFGVPGQKQDGIDIYARRPGTALNSVYQCKCVKKLTPGDIVKAVSTFLGGEWAEKSERFVLCVSVSADHTDIRRVAEEQAELLQKRSPPIELDIWDAEELSDKLKARPDLVADFFGPYWRRWFFPPEDEIGLINLRETTGPQIPATRLIIIDSAPEFISRELKRFARENPDQYVRLEDQVGNPPDPELIASTISAPPYWMLSDNVVQAWRILAMYAERSGRWDEARKAWERVSVIEREPSDIVDALVLASVAAGVAQNRKQSEALLQRARKIAPDHPRLRLQEIDQLAEADAILKQLEPLHTEDPALGGLIAAHKALTCLRLPDMKKSREYLNKARGALGNTLTIQGVEISIAVQAERLDYIDGRAVALIEATRTKDEALALREKLLKVRRVEEAARLLMLASDALAIVGDFDGAGQLLRKATEDEISYGDGAAVLAEGALRIIDPALALMITRTAPETPGIRRIRAEAYLDLGSRGERDRALKTLDELIKLGGPEALQAALARLVAAAENADISWSEKAAAVLRTSGFEGAAANAQVQYFGIRKDWDSADDLLTRYQTERWTGPAGLRVALMRGDPVSLTTAAKHALGFAPSSSLRVDCGRALYRAGDLERANETLLGVARDGNAHARVRATAFSLLVRLVGENRDDWETAFNLHKEWTEVLPTDVQACLWAPRVANRRLTQRARRNDSYAQSHKAES